MRATHHPEGPRAQIRLRQVDCPRLVRVGDLHHLERVCGLPKSSQARFLWEKLYDSILLEYRHGDTAGGREADSNLSDDIKRGIQGVTHPHQETARGKKEFFVWENIIMEPQDDVGARLERDGCAQLAISHS